MEVPAPAMQNAVPDAGAQPVSLDEAAWTPPSWDEVVRDHGDRVYRLAYRLTGNTHDAEDLTQETFIRVFRSLASYKDVLGFALLRQDAGSAMLGTGTTPKSLATVKLSPPNPSSKAQGVAEAFVQTGKIYLALVAINLAANSHNFYAVWLSNSPSDSRLIGFSPPVTGNGRLQAAGTLHTSDNRYKQLLLTLETTAHPKSPGTTVLSGPFSLKSS